MTSETAPSLHSNDRWKRAIETGALSVLILLLLTALYFLDVTRSLLTLELYGLVFLPWWLVWPTLVVSVFPSEMIERSTLAAQAFFVLGVSGTLDFTVAATIAYFVRLPWWLKILIAIMSVYAGAGLLLIFLMVS